MSQIFSNYEAVKLNENTYFAFADPLGVQGRKVNVSGTDGCYQVFPLACPLACFVNKVATFSKSKDRTKLAYHTDLKS